ncbi:MAG: hypothetical protein OQK44_01390, partial [Gammaproteobacteria bacterium]|nr:hypothetical protein [Gammaproteobacteria bacterium]
MTIVQLSLQYLKRFVQSRAKAILLPVLLSVCIASPAIADEITLNLKDADIRALISTVSKFTGKNFI